MRKVVSYLFLMISIAFVFSGCSNECPSSIKNGQASLEAEAKKLDQMPKQTKAEKIAIADAIDEIAKKCEKLVEDNKEHAGCKLNDKGSWDLEKARKACIDIASKAKALRGVIANLP